MEVAGELEPEVTSEVGVVDDLSCPLSTVDEAPIFALTRVEVLGTLGIEVSLVFGEEGNVVLGIS